MSFSCKSYMFPYWIHNNGRLLPNVKVYSFGILEIKETHFMNSGYYECLGYTRQMKNFAARSQLVVLGEWNYNLICIYMPELISTDCHECIYKLG